MMFFKERKTERVKMVHRICIHCQESILVKSPTRLYLKGDLCDACKKIQVHASMVGFVDKSHSYIWYNGKEENGPEWYIKARNKLIEKMDKEKELEDKKYKMSLKKIKKSIDKW